MTLAKLIASAVLGLGLSMPLMAGSALSQELIAKAAKEVKSITSKELAKMIENEDDVWMLDIREPYMIPEGSIEGMENVAIARGLLEFDLPSEIKDKNAFIVVYCRSGKGAALATKTIQNDLHYTNVHYLVGGLDSWLEEGNSIFSHLGELKLAK